MKMLNYVETNLMLEEDEKQILEQAFLILNEIEDRFDNFKIDCLKTKDISPEILSKDTIGITKRCLSALAFNKIEALMSISNKEDYDGCD